MSTKKSNRKAKRGQSQQQQTSPHKTNASEPVCENVFSESHTTCEDAGVSYRLNNPACGTPDTTLNIEGKYEECVENAVRRADAIHRQRVLEAWQRRINEGYVPKESLEPVELLDLMIDGARDFVVELLKVSMSPEAIYQKLTLCLEPYDKVIPYQLVQKWVRDYRKSDDVHIKGISGGYVEGLNKGLNEGYKAGYSDGFDKGLNEEYKKGYADGFDKGHAKGYDKGYDSGWDDDNYKENYYRHYNDDEDYDEDEGFKVNLDVPSEVLANEIVSLKEQVGDKVIFRTMSLEQFYKENPDARDATWTKKKLTTQNQAEYQSQSER